MQTLPIHRVVKSSYVEKSGTLRFHRALYIAWSGVSSRRGESFVTSRSKIEGRILTTQSIIIASGGSSAVPAFLSLNTRGYNLGGLLDKLYQCMQDNAL
ncbi:MAG: hypothetical protein COV74_01980 [Candidatus Omnitrophica bacterium CG11_big_fil_rev_8_21_14_0_20_45_26]|uniref:Uncharacterized protein n=1 Tax=Candidatus Abzuiibacterium crystallinum TaxID=1974748 RepID=A0A2H0LTZ0_9BACT|nr:MAG: hypothetical protein COV74_01980 [Candidatus Omnitrophica bacterium CG11_big_fil_rev_8_21_14_0_20_45_26]PIW65335.1 MAG: hypothetical protein COW12_02385 [Candidatus Omnitrophica bacterium CG12_big_fil_rev_8_21_14_0_65_45_16]